MYTWMQNWPMTKKPCHQEMGPVHFFLSLFHQTLDYVEVGKLSATIESFSKFIL